MRRFSSLVIREVLLGLLLGAASTLAVNLAVGVSAATKSFLKMHIPASLFVAASGAIHFKLLASVVAVSLFLLWQPPIVSFIRKLLRSWLAGVVTGIFPIWFLLSLFFFLRLDHWGVGGSSLLVAIGLLPVLISGLIARYHSTGATNASITIPTSAFVPGDISVKREVTFDLPINDWSEDRLKRGPFIQSVANLILNDKAPVLAIVGPFGEGKSSALNLLAASLSPRNDLIVIKFSSWLPGDEQTLAFSLFGTIAKQVKSRYLIPGLGNELNKFARLLAGTVPKVGETLKNFFEEPSQVEQLRSLKSLLSGLPIRVVVLVDELDRMDKEELYLLLKAIRGVVDLPNITYVCAFDKKAVIQLISENDPLYGQFYLEKFFPMQLALPRTDQQLLSKLFDRKLESICKTFKLLQVEKDKKAFNEQILPLWHTSIKHSLTNFRRLALFFNALQMSLEPVYAEVNFLDMMVLQLVKMISEETYEFIYDNGPLFYYPSWRVNLWLERLSVDDEEETTIRGKRLNAFFDSLPSVTRGQVTELLRKIFPTVDRCLRSERFSLRVQSEQDAEMKKRIYHPDYFPRYFIHQVPSGMFGRAEMEDFITRMNAEEGVEPGVAILCQTISKLATDPWKRWGFLDALVAATNRLGAVQSEALIVGIAEISGSLESAFMGLSAWDRARAVVFAAANRFSGTPKLQEILVTAIRRAKSDGFAADILLFSTTMRKQNKIITEWQNVDEATFKMAFGERMRTKYSVGSQREFAYCRDDLSPFLVWVGMSDEDQTQEVNFFRNRFQHDPADQGRFLGWVLPKDVAYQDDPLIIVGKLFPVDELFESVRQSPEDRWLERDRKSVQWFLELVEQRRAGTPAAVPRSPGPAD